MKYFWGILFTCLFIGHGWAVSVTNASATAGLSAPVMGSLTADDAEKIILLCFPDGKRFFENRMGSGFYEKSLSQKARVCGTGFVCKGCSPEGRRLSA